MSCRKTPPLMFGCAAREVDGNCFPMGFNRGRLWQLWQRWSTIKPVASLINQQNNTLSSFSPLCIPACQLEFNDNSNLIRLPREAQLLTTRRVALCQKII